MSSLLKKKGAASFKPRAPARRPGVTAPPSTSLSIPPVEKHAHTPAPPAAHNVPIQSVEVESLAAPEVQPAPSVEKPAARQDSASISPPQKDSAAPAASARKDSAAIPPPTKDIVQPLVIAAPLEQEPSVPVPPSTRRRLSQAPIPPQPQETVPISLRPPSIPPTITTEPTLVTAPSGGGGGIVRGAERPATISTPQDTATIRPPVSQPTQQHIDSEDIERNDTATIRTQDESMDLSAMGAGETGHPSQLIPVVPLNPDGTSGTPITVQPPRAKPRARKRKLDDANIDIRPSIEVQVHATKAPRTSAPRKPRKPREPRAATSSTPKPRTRKKRAETPEDAEDQEIDHSTIKMADLCKDLKIGKKFSKHDEIKQRDIDRKAKAKLRRENPELVGTSDDERPTVTARSETEVPLQTTSVGPRMRLVDGQIVIDESSLNLDRHKLAAANAGVMEIIEENEFTRITTSGTFMKREKNIFWDLEAEEKFYVGLRMFGTDFEMISKMFPDRNRRQIKLKFNKEERLYPSKINSALLGEKVPIDFDEYKSHTGLEYEDVAVINAEREEIEAEQNAEEARVEAELAEATRQKKAAIHATRGPEGKENDRFGGGSNAAKSKNKGKKKNKASAFGGGEEVEYLGDI
ncbi:hypothetical protein V491_03372 [Pseudogymnoascus sp. VKM F-3775]|nr:hypothetical protein V491_03372 [Pseudogymnoascus sp. VKM F-3775]